MVGMIRKLSGKEGKDMRRIALYLGMAAAAVVASCSVQEKEFETVKLGSGKVFALSVSMMP